jgi:small ligand-binding sensory domain FIST
MKWTSAVSEHRFLKYAVAECAVEIKEALGDQSADLLVVFVSAHHAARYDELPGLVRELAGDGVLIGCSGGGIIGAGREVEQSPGFAMAAAVLPDVTLSPFHIEDSDLPDGDAPPGDWQAIVGASTSDGPHMLILADPFSLRGENLLAGLDYAFPRAAKIGGLASGGNQPQANALFAGELVHRTGAVGVAMHGNIEIDTVVAQGCRPIGERMQITSCERNMLLALDGKPPLEVLREMFQGLSERDRQLAQNSLFLGVVMDAFNEAPKIGDYLIRNIVGMDARAGALSIGEMLKEGQRVQFHLRDAETSTHDLDAMLDQYMGSHEPHSESGALLFQCLGRGAYLDGRPDHDTDMFREKVSAMPLTGFFCNGEIGQVSGSTYLHGYTSSFGIFRPKE